LQERLVQHTKPRGFRYRRGLGRVACGVFQPFRHQPVRQVQRDVVEHDGGDDLVRAAMRLEPRRWERPERACECARRKRERQVQRRGHACLRPDPRRRECAHQQLPCRANIKKPRLQRDRHRQTRQHQQRHVVQHGVPRFQRTERLAAWVARRALQDNLETLAERLACRQHQRAEHRQHHQRAQQRRRNPRPKHHLRRFASCR
jgi:hypothetical protein